MPDDQIRQNLVGQGWQEGDVRQAMTSGTVILKNTIKNHSLILWVILLITVFGVFGFDFSLLYIFVLFKLFVAYSGVSPFAVSLICIVLGMGLMTVIQRRTHSETLPIELLYWFGGVTYSAYKSADFFLKSDFFSLIVAGLVFVISTIFFLFVRPPRMRSLVFLAITIILCGTIYFSRVVLPAQQTTETVSKITQSLNIDTEPNLNLLAEELFIGNNGFTIRPPKGWIGSNRYSNQIYAPSGDERSAYMQIFSEDGKVVTFPARFEKANIKLQFKTVSGLDVRMYIKMYPEHSMGEFESLVSNDIKIYSVVGTFPDTAFDESTKVIIESLKTFEVTVPDKPLSSEPPIINQDGNISKNDCGFRISPPNGWPAVNGVTFRNNSLGSEIKLSCKPDGFEDNYYVLFTPAQSLMTKPDSGFYITSAENIVVGNRKAYLFSEEHEANGVENYELVLMIDSGIKNASKNQMDIIYAYMPGKYKTQYEAILKEAIFSYKR